MTKKLEETFKRGRRDFKRLYEDDTWYIYDVTINYKDGVKDHCVEVFKKRTAPLKVYDNGWKKVDGETAEVYPSDESFGIYSAWCVNTFERAMRYVNGELPIKN